MPMRTVSLSPRIAVAALSAVFLGLSGLTPVLLAVHNAAANHSECSDGLDNNRDGHIDFPQDTGCISLDDLHEGTGPTATFVTITDGRDTIRPGDSSIYVISLIQQREEFKDVSVTLHIPAYVDIISSDDGGVIQGEYVRWDHVTLAYNVSKKLTVQSRVKSTTPIGTLVVAEVTSDLSRTTDTTATVGPNAFPMIQPFGVSITDGKTYVASETNLTYVITAQNLTRDPRTTIVQALIPQSVNLLAIPNAASYAGHKLVWNDVAFAPGEEKKLSFEVHVPRRQNYYPIYLRALAGSATASDNTVIYTGFVPGVLDLSISADKSQARPGDLITYTVIVTNPTNQLATAAKIDAAMPIYGEFVSVTEGGFWDGKTIHWLGMQIAPQGKRVLNFTVRVRSDAPIGKQLQGTATTDGITDGTTTTVALYSIGAGGRNSYISGNGYVAPAPQTAVLLRKTADRSEVVPGGTVGYTITVQNTLLHVIRSAVVTDSFNPTYLSVQNTGNASVMGQGLMQWKLPDLAPGQIWTAHYTLAIAKNAPHALSVNNIARITGPDVGDASINERVTITRTGVMTQLPATGAPMDILLALMFSPLALAGAFAQRRLMA